MWPTALPTILSRRRAVDDRCVGDGRVVVLDEARQPLARLGYQSGRVLSCDCPFFTAATAQPFQSNGSAANRRFERNGASRMAVRTRRRTPEVDRRSAHRELREDSNLLLRTDDRK